MSLDDILPTSLALPKWDALLLDNSVTQWGIALAVATGSFFLLHLLKRLGSARLRKWAEQTETRVDDTISGLVDRTSWFTLTVLAMVLGARVLTLPFEVDRVASRVAALVLLLQVAIWVSFTFQDLLLRAIERRERAGELPRSVTALISVGGRLVVWTVAFLVAVQTLGYDATALVTGLGIGGVAIGLALQGILKDIFAFLAIVLDGPFAVGDTIKVGDLFGTVERIGIKTTRIRSITGEELVFGNHDLLSSRVRNFHDVQQRRVTVNIGVLYDTSPALLAQISDWLRTVIEPIELADFQRCFLVGLGESSIDFELVVTIHSVDYNEYMKAQQEIILATLLRLEEGGVGIAFPTRTLHLPAGTELALSGISGNTSDRASTSDGT
ncbi:MAG: mechanosensitive ion channel family protein [Thermoanaerobaculia bacterium]|nr:mechanosensitive ion channel family protein [Thermoanaerobaculia bacterium]